MRRIQRDVCHEEFVKNLTTGETAPFKEIWRLLLFAASIGVRDGQRRPLDKVDSGKAMPDTYFSTPGWRGFLYLLGITASNSSDCLRSTTEAQDALVTAFEEHANYGLFLLSNRLKSSPSQLDELISMLIEANRQEAAKPNVEDLI